MIENDVAVESREVQRREKKSQWREPPSPLTNDQPGS